MRFHGDRERIESELELVLRVAPDQADELGGSLARYACVLASSYLEAAVRELIVSFCSRRAAPQVVRYIENQMHGFRNPNTEKILQVVGHFDSNARSTLEGCMTDQERDSVDSISVHRNNIAHGRRSGISIAQAGEYYSEARRMIQRVRSVMLPANGKTAQETDASGRARARR